MSKYTPQNAGSAFELDFRSVPERTPERAGRKTNPFCSIYLRRRWLGAEPGDGFV